MGYRNVPLLLFKDESQSVARKVQFKRNGEVLPPNTRSSGSKLGLLDLTNEKAFGATPRPTYALAPSSVDLALSYFMRSYIPYSTYDYLPSIFTTTKEVADCLSSAVLATALASLSISQDNSELMKYARLFYCKTLTRTNAALASTETALLDSTLVSVLLLGLYESLSSTSRLSTVAWSAHTQGALELVRLRGVQQLQTPIGRRLFAQTANHVRGSCIYSQVPIPESFLELSKTARPFLSVNMPPMKLGFMLDKIASFAARIRKVTSVKVYPALLEELISLEREAQNVEDMLPDDWHYQVLPPQSNTADSNGSTMHSEDDPITAYQCLAHKYPGYWCARFWNVIRVMRIFFNADRRLIVTAIERAVAADKTGELSRHFEDIDTEAIRVAAESTTVAAVRDILASVPHFFDGTGGSSPIEATRSLIWPLTIAARASARGSPAQQYALKTLKRITNRSRIPQAFHAAEAVPTSGLFEW